MSEENKYIESDDLMRSILSQGQEEVPAHIWEGVSSELDRIEAAESRKTAELWFRRAVVAVAAAAAVAVGIFTDWNRNGDIIETSDRYLISVTGGSDINTGNPLASPAPIAEREILYLADAAEEVHEAFAKIEEEYIDTEIRESEKQAPEDIERHQEERWTEIWEDDEEVEKIRRKKRTSISLSGIAGTNGVQTNGMSPLRRPSISTSRPKTGIEQKSSESTYGLPVSFGAGVKVDLSDRWSLGTGVNYTLLTRKFFGTYTLVGSDESIKESVSSDIRNVQQYIGIPLNIYFNMVRKDFLNFYAYAGGAVERCISDKYDILNTEHIYKGSVHGVQLSANAGIGVEFTIAKYLGFYFDPSIRYYFDCGQPKSIRTAQPFMLGLEMGLRINL